MRRILELGAAAVLVAGGFGPAMAREGSPGYPLDLAPRRGERPYDRPAQAGQGSSLRADTLGFGWIDGDGFAILGETWTFDHGGADPLEGWYAQDATQQTATFFRRITGALWSADPNNLVPAPVLRGTGSAWVGAFGSEANDLCWEAGLGYGNSWCQRLESPVRTYTGGNVSVGWTHFNDTEEFFDYTFVYLRTLPSQTQTPLASYTGGIGLAGNHPASPPVGATDGDVLGAADFAGETQYQIVFEMTSDGSWSDQDGLFTTEYGPAAFDDVTIGATTYTFESGLDGWTAATCVGIGSFLGVHDVSEYEIEDPCECELAGNVLTFHDPNGEHPYGQHVLARSNPVDVASDVVIPGPGQLSIFCDWDQYSVLPQANGVFYRPGWEYYPALCEVTGEVGWSGRVGQNAFFYVGETPVCVGNRSSATQADDPVPPDAEQVRFIFEVYASCDAFGIPPEICTSQTNFTPIIDNVEIRFTKIPLAPPIAADVGHAFQDGFAQGTQVDDPSQPGNADISRDLNFGFGPVVLGDSLLVTGPIPTASTRWEAKIWFRVPRVGPLADATYTNWRDRVADGYAIDPLLAAGGPVEYTFAHMDSFQIGTNVSRNKFVTYFREDDDDYDAGAGELRAGNEILADGVFFPGTQVEYFLTSNYLGSSEYFVLPDTSGGFALEFEILPSWREADVWIKFPCLLYIDAFNRGAEDAITAALRALGLDYDKYDYLDAAASWSPPMARGDEPGSNNGCTLPQLLGYRGILLNTGTFGEGAMDERDFLLFNDWLTALECDGAEFRQGFIANGDGIGGLIGLRGPTFLSSRLGATQIASDYALFAGDEDYCVRLEAPFLGGEAFGTSNSTNDYEYDAWGNWCPQKFTFDVLGAVGTGVGNRVYLDVGDLATETMYNQVARQELIDDNYRTLIDGVSYHHMSEVDPVEECVGDSAHIVTAAYNEIAAALEWIYGVGNLPSLCVDPCGGDDVPESGPWGTTSVTRLHPAAPNPFNPRTVLRFSLAHGGPVELTIHDAAGRRVRALVQGTVEAGRHETLWDGTDDGGRTLPSGIYWARLEAGGRTSSSRMIRLK